jgi:hypothetical protein
MTFVNEELKYNHLKINQNDKNTRKFPQTMLGLPHITYYVSRRYTVLDGVASGIIPREFRARNSPQTSVLFHPIDDLHLLRS